MDITQRIQRLEKKMGITPSKKSVKESVPQESWIKRIKFRGGEFKRFSSSDWRTFSGAEPFPEGGDPFITELTLTPEWKRALEKYFDEEIYNEVSVILSSGGKSDCQIEMIALGEETGTSYVRNHYFESFEKAVGWIKKQLMNPFPGVGFVRDWSQA